MTEIDTHKYRNTETREKEQRHKDQKKRTREQYVLVRNAYKLRIEGAHVFVRPRCRSIRANGASL